MELKEFIQKYNLTSKIEDAFEEQGNHYDSYDHWLNHNRTQPTAFSCAFTWRKTEEGHSYWSLVEKIWREQKLGEYAVWIQLEQIVKQLKEKGI